MVIIKCLIQFMQIILFLNAVFLHSRQLPSTIYIYTVYSFIHSSLVTPLSSAGLQVRSGASPVTLGTRQENTPWTGCTHASKP